MSEVKIEEKKAPQAPHSGEWDQFTRQAAIVILMLGVLFLIIVLRPLLNLMGVTGIVILILSYPVNKLRKSTKIPYSLAVMLVFVPLAIVIFLLFGNLTNWVVQNTQALVVTLNSDLPIDPELMDSLEETYGSAFSAKALLDKLTGLVTSQFQLLVEVVTFTSLTLFLAFLFILEMPANIARSFHNLSAGSQREFGILLDKLANVWNGWLKSTVITSIIIGVTTGLELFLFGIPYAGIIGVITGFLNLIPTFGAIVSYLLVIIVTYTQGSTTLSLAPATLTFLVWGVNVLINQVARLVIFPRLAGKAVHLPVFFVILGLVVAGVLWGVIGLILVIPLLGTVREVLFYVLKKINRQEPYPGEQLDEGFWSTEITE